MTVEERREHQRGPGRPAGCQAVRQFGGQQPGHRGGRRAIGHPLPAAQEGFVVIAAGQRGVPDHRTGLGERQRLAAEVGGQVLDMRMLARVRAETARQVGHGLAGAEPPHREHQCPALAGNGRGIPGRDQHPAGGPGRDEPVQIRRAAQVIEHDQPRPAGLAEPAGEPGRDRSGVARRRGSRRRGRRRVAAQHRGPAGGGHPGQQVHLAGAPQRLGERDRELGLAAWRQPVRRSCRGRVRGRQHHRRAGKQRGRQGGRRLRPGGVPVGQRRHGTRPDRPRRLPVSRPGWPGRAASLLPAVHGRQPWPEAVIALIAFRDNDITFGGHSICHLGRCRRGRRHAGSRAVRRPPRAQPAGPPGQPDLPSAIYSVACSL